MARKRTDTILDTRAKLLAAGRAAFAVKGHAEAPMDDLTAKVA